MNIETRLKRAGQLVVIGLLIEFLSLLPLHPLAFIAFVGLGIPFIAAGIIYFLLGIASQPAPSDNG